MQNYRGEYTMKSYKRSICLLVLVLANLAFAQDKAEVFPQIGHIGPVVFVAFSPNGRYLLSGAEDSTLKLWDASSEREIRTFTDISYYANATTFTSDGRYILTATRRKSLKLFEVDTGRVAREFIGHSDYIGALALSRDGRYALSSDYHNDVIVWDMVTGSSIRTLHCGKHFLNAIASMAVSTDGRSFVAGCRDAMKILDIATGEEFHDLHGVYDGLAHGICSVAFSPDGRFVLSGGDDKVMLLWDAATGAMIRSYVGHKETIYAVAFSHDGRYALSAAWDNTAKLWDVNTGKELQTLAGHTRPVNAVAFSPDDRNALTGSSDHSVKYWVLGKENPILTLGGTLSPLIDDVAVSSNERYLLTGGRDKVLRLWDLLEGRQVRVFKGHNGSIVSVAFSPDGRTALSGGFSEAILWDMATGRTLRKFTDSSPDSGLIYVAYSFDGRFVLLTGRYLVRIFEMSTGKVIRTIDLHGKNSVSDFSAALSPDGRYVATSEGTLWEVRTGKENRVFKDFPRRTRSVIFSPDGRHVLASGWPSDVEKPEPTLSLWNCETGNMVRSFNSVLLFFRVLFSPDGKYIYSLGQGSLKQWNVADGRELMSIDNQALWAESMALCSERKLAVIAGSHITPRIWDLRNGKEMVSFMALNDNDWITSAQDGYYNASEKGHALMNVHLNNAVYGMDQFYDVFYRPDIIQARLAGDNTDGLVGLTIDDALRAPPPIVEFTITPRKSYFESAVKICYKIYSTGGGIGEVRLFHNGKLFFSDGYYRDLDSEHPPVHLADISGKVLLESLRNIAVKNKPDMNAVSAPQKEESLEECKVIEPIAGENDISLAAFNRGNTIQSIMKTIKFTSTRSLHRRHLYVLAVGIDRFADSSVNLKYAAKDAADIGRALAETVGSHYVRDHIHVETITNETASKASILSKIKELVPKIKAGDAFILYMATHGLLLENQFYMVTHDYAGAMTKDNVISSNEIIDISKTIHSLNQLIILDTCHAGGVDGIIKGLYDARMSVLAKNLGLHIFASASTYQEALDGYQENGLFTHSLLMGLKDAKAVDTNNDATVSVMELGFFARRQTEKISIKLGHPQSPLIIDYGKDIPLYSFKR